MRDCGDILSLKEVMHRLVFTTDCAVITEVGNRVV